jgi:hypothetical protein
MHTHRTRRLTGPLLTAGLLLGATACGGSGDQAAKSADPNAPVTISVDCEPPTTKEVMR